MKKIISFILVAILCLGVLTSCAQINGFVDSIKDKLGIGEPDESVGPTLEDASSYLNDIYKEKNENTLVDYDVVGKVIIDGVPFTITWTSDNETVVVRESTKVGFYTVDVPDKNDAEFTYKLTATITNADGESVERSFSFKVPVIDNSGITSEPVEGVAYKIFMNQANLGQRLFALNASQNNKNKYILTTNDPAKAADFYAEKVEGGYKFYTEIDGVKNYVLAQLVVENPSEPDHQSKYIGFTTGEGTVFNYVQETNSWQTTLDGIKYVVGTYNAYETICISEATFITPENTGVSQFVIEFMNAEYAETLKPDEAPESPTDAKGILDLLYSLEDGKTTAGSFTLTGVITALDSYGNPTIVVGNYTEMPVLCYKLTNSQFVVGATITVTAKMLKNYMNTYEMMECTLDSITLPGDTPSVPSDKTYTVVTELKTGDKVLIGAPAYGKLLSSLKYNNGFYNAGVDYSATNFANVTDAEIWTVTVNDDGTYTFTDSTGNKLGMADSYSSFNSEGPNFSWALEAKEDNTFFVKNTGRDLYIEWYDSNNNWSAYGNTSNADLFKLSFYIEGEGSGSTTPVDPEPTLTGKDLLDAAYALASGESMTGPYTLTGVITALDSWNNPTIVFGEYTEMPIYCYKLVDSRFVVGATITVTAGSIKNYNGTIEMMDCTLDSITVPGEDGGDDTDTPVVPEDGVYTIPQVLAAAEGTAVIVKGTVVEIYQAWNPTFNNVSFYIADAEGNKLLVFRTGTNANIGDQVTVTGTATLYNNVIQIAQGGTTVIDVAHVCSEFTEATCTTAAACVVCGTVSSPALGHSYTNGTCINCGEPEPTSPAKTYHLQATIGETTYYWSGAASGGKGVITTSESEAVVLYVEEADNGYVHIYYVDGNGTRQYLYFTDGNTGFKTSSDANTIKYDEATGKVYEDSFSDTRYAATYGVQDIRSYKASNVPGSSNNAFMLLTPIA